MDTEAERVALERELEDIESELAIVIGLANGSLLRCACGRNIEKDGGCNYVKCLCGVEWCWECRKEKYRECNDAQHNSH